MTSVEAEERAVLLAMQDGLPLAREPYAVVAAKAGLSHARVLEIIRNLLDAGKIKRLGAIPNHYALGITANGMSVWDVPDDRVAEAGRALGARPEVTHCYRRPRRLPLWPYNLFAMVHGRSRDEVRVAVERLAGELGLGACPHDILFSTRILKKRGMRVRDG